MRYNNLFYSMTVRWRSYCSYQRNGQHPPERGTFPYVSGYQVPVNRPLFYADLTSNDPLFFFSLHPMTPLFSSVHTHWPLFPLKYQILHTNCKFLHALHAFREIYKFCCNFGLKLHFCTLNDFGESTSKKKKKKKKTFFFEPTPNDPLFSTKSYTECPVLSFSGRYLYVTIIFECPPPPATSRLQSEIQTTMAFIHTLAIVQKNWRPCF